MWLHNVWQQIPQIDRGGCATDAREETKLVLGGDTLVLNTDATCSRLSILQFANGPKRSMGHVLGAEKGNLLIRGAEADDATGRPRRLNPVNPCQLGVPGVA